MNDLIGLPSLKYKSDAILERRRRILSETRTLIAETGYENFNIRDLCARADIAQKTLYNAFGSKDNVIATAVQEFINEFVARTTFRFPSNTLDSLLEWNLLIQAEDMRVAAYTRAMNSVFYTSAGGSFVRKRIRQMCAGWYESFVQGVADANNLAAGVTAERLNHMLVSNAFSITCEWCSGEIPDEEFLDRSTESVLMVVLGATRGKINLRARRWLEDLREQSASWVSLRSLTAAAAPPEPAEASGRAASAATGVEKAQRKRAAVG